MPMTCEFCGKHLSAEHAGAKRHRRCMGKVKPRADRFDTPFAVGDTVVFAQRPFVEARSRMTTRAGARGKVLKVFPETGRVMVAWEDGRTVPMSVDRLLKSAGIAEPGAVRTARR